MNALDCPLAVRLNNTEASFDVGLNSSDNHIFYDLKSGRGYDLNVKVVDGKACFGKSEVFQEEQTFSFTASEEVVRLQALSFEM